MPAPPAPGAATNGFHCIPAFMHIPVRCAAATRGRSAAASCRHSAPMAVHACQPRRHKHKHMQALLSCACINNGVVNCNPYALLTVTSVEELRVLDVTEMQQLQSRLPCLYPDGRTPRFELVVTPSEENSEEELPASRDGVGKQRAAQDGLVANRPVAVSALQSAANVCRDRAESEAAGEQSHAELHASAPREGDAAPLRGRGRQLAAGARARSGAKKPQNPPPPASCPSRSIAAAASRGGGGHRAAGAGANVRAPAGNQGATLAVPDRCGVRSGAVGDAGGGAVARSVAHGCRREGGYCSFTVWRRAACSRRPHVG